MDEYGNINTALTSPVDLFQPEGLRLYLVADVQRAVADANFQTKRFGTKRGLQGQPM